MGSLVKMHKPMVNTHSPVVKKIADTWGIDYFFKLKELPSCEQDGL
jgi:hypothetical protein